MKWILALALICLGGVGAALAAPSLSRRLQEYEGYAQQLERHPAAHKVTRELGTLRAWLGEARAYLKQDEEDDLKATLRRAHAQIRLIDALLARAGAKEKAAAQLKQAEAKEAEAERAREAAFAAERALAELERGAAPEGAR